MKLVFVYNADSGIFNTLTDIAHKVFSPDTYSCQLCNLTHGYFQAREEWVVFLQDLEAEIIFLHRDEYVKKYSHDNVDLPAIFVAKGGELNLWIDNSIINKMTSTDELMEMIRAAVLRRQAGEKEEDVFLHLPV